LAGPCAGIGDMINNSLKQYKQNSDINLIDDGLKIVYGEKQFSEDISSLNKNEKVELAGNLTSGVPIKTPVFDGASESEISVMLKGGRF
jgi:DNA-directed RNA polymerase subunit beta